MPPDSMFDIGFNTETAVPTRLQAQTEVLVSVKQKSLFSQPHMYTSLDAIAQLSHCQMQILLPRELEHYNRRGASQLIKNLPVL